MPSKKQDALRRKWYRIERGEEKDDYQNPFLSHFGFHDSGEPYKSYWVGRTDKEE